MFFFFFIVLKMSEWKHLIKIKHLYIYTEFCLLCQALLTPGGFNSLTLTLQRVAKASPFPGGFH